MMDRIYRLVTPTWVFVIAMVMNIPPWVPILKHLGFGPAAVWGLPVQAVGLTVLILRLIAVTKGYRS